MKNVSRVVQGCRTLNFYSTKLAALCENARVFSFGSVFGIHVYRVDSSLARIRKFTTKKACGHKFLGISDLSEDFTAFSLHFTVTLDFLSVLSVGVPAECPATVVHSHCET